MQGRGIPTPDSFEKFHCQTLSEPSRPANSHWWLPDLSMNAEPWSSGAREGMENCLFRLLADNRRLFETGIFRRNDSRMDCYIHLQAEPGGPESHCQARP